MSFYLKLRGGLKGKVKKDELELLPRSYSLLGKLMLIRLKPKLLKHRKLIGKRIKELFPYIDAVFLEKSIEGIKRKPKVELLAGGKRHSGPVTQTLHREHGCSFLLDVSEVMWSKGNKEERDRLSKLVRRGEVIVDMFAGIGYFLVCIAKYSEAKKLYGIEINPRSFEYLERNLWLNGVAEKVEIINGDCRRVSFILEDVADRVIMGYLFHTEKYLPAAFRILKDRGIIHYHFLSKENELNRVQERIVRVARNSGYALIKIQTLKKIKSYSPKVFHFVMDVEFSRA